MSDFVRAQHVVKDVFYRKRETRANHDAFRSRESERRASAGYSARPRNALSAKGLT